MDWYLSWIAQWLEYQHVRLEIRVQDPVKDRIFLFEFYNILVLWGRRVIGVSGSLIWSKNSRWN